MAMEHASRLRPLITSRNRERVTCLVAVLVLAIAGNAGLPRPLRAQEAEVGWEGVAGTGSAYFGLELPRALDPHNEILTYMEVNYIYYRTPGATGETRVSSPGGLTALGLRHTADRWQVEILPGLEVRRTSEREANGSMERTSEVALAGEVSLDCEIARDIQAHGDFFHSRVLDYTWARVGVDKGLAGRASDSTAIGLRLGPEGTVEISPDLPDLALGLHLEITLPFGAGVIDLRGGVERNNYDAAPRETRPYVGVEASRDF